MSNVSTRLVRLLNMVPYFQANPRITRAEAAAALGVTEKQLHTDLNQLWLCGLPGYGPGDLIDFDFEGDTVEVTFAAGMDHPLRLTSPEATGILVALRALLDVPGMVDPEAARSAIAKIESAAGEVSGSVVAEDPTPVQSQATAVRAAVARALEEDLTPLGVLADMELWYQLPTGSGARAPTDRYVKRTFSIDETRDIRIQPFLLIVRTGWIFTAHALNLRRG